jgi:multidrug resistance efflux pump
MHKRPPVAVVIVVILVLVVIAGYFIYTEILAPSTDNSALAASGTVEATQITISPEIGGKVAEVLAEEGQMVKVGDLLFRLDDTLLQAQREQAQAVLNSAEASAQTAEAAVATAQAQYDLALFSALNEAQPARALAWQQDTPAEYDLPVWYFTQPEQRDAFNSEVENAAAALVDAQTRLGELSTSAGGEDFLKAESRLLAAQTAFLTAQDVRERSADASNAEDVKDAAQESYDDAKEELDDAQQAYNDILTTEDAADILQARADLAVAQERYDTAQDRLRALQTGKESPKVKAAASTLEQARVAADQSALAVDQAKANLNLIDVQLDKLSILAPADGVLMTRLVETGEVLNPGAGAMALGLLDDLSITVYIPEDRYGELSLGQSATVTADSFPGEVFDATIINISDQAEFTPRNVQTVEGRASTVFAIKLAVTDPDGKLKPGMPADVVFVK